MTDRWTHSAVTRLLNYQLCPRCGEARLVAGVCSACDADLTGDVAIELAASTLHAVEVLQERQAIIDRLPIAVRPAAAPMPMPMPQSVSAAPLPAYGGAQPAPQPTAAVAVRPSSQVSLQSVLAVAGAGLFAVAALFFTFLNPDLEGQHDLRSIIVAVTTIVFLVGAWLLTRSGLRFSGETVGALGMVFVALDVWSVSRYAQQPVDAWAAAAIATLIAGTLMVAIALLARIRTWLWAGVVAVTLVPAFFGYGADSDWYSILGHVGTGFAAVAVVGILPLLARRFASSLRAEQNALVVVRLAVLPTIGIQLVALTPPAPFDEYLAAAAVLFALAVLAAVSTRDSLPRLWSLGAGALATTAAAVVPLAWIDLFADSWMVAGVPLGALVSLVGLTGLVQLGASQRAGLHRLTLLVGAWIVTVLVSVPSGMLALLHNTTGSGGWLDDETSGAALVGVSVPFAAGLLLAFAAPRVARSAASATAVRSIAGASAGWFGMYAILTLTSLGALPVETRLAIGIGAAIATGILVWRVRAVAVAPLRLRLPLVVGAHVILLHALVQAWPEGVVGTIAQIAIIGTIVLLASTVARYVRPVHIGAAVALGLFVFSGALGEYTVLEPDVIVALTATLALLTAIAATLITTLRVEYWYAVLIVAVVPFVLALGLRLTDDTQWTALPAAIAALLGAVLLVSQRTGHHVALRALGAAMIVPALAVVTIGAVPSITTSSGSPIVLPIIAGLVAVTLPFTVAIGRNLERIGIVAEESRIARLAVEASALFTAGVAVVIALLRAAAGFDTTFLVLAIVGLGGAATALFSNRRYGWVISYAAWSGAIWCLFALLQVDVVEPYVLPPAIAAVLIGGFAVYRGRPGHWMVITGLVVGAIPTLALLAVERGDDLATGWRLWGLLAASAVLIALGFLFARITRLESLRVPVLGVAILAAAAGAVGAVTMGLDRSHPAVDAVTFDIAPVLGLAAIGAMLAAVAARLIAPTASRWLYVPALAYLLIGTSAGIRHDAVSIWTLFGLMTVYLVGMLVVVARTRTRETALPPAWLWFAFAWIAAVVSWSQREVLRVEGYSIPMALALLTAGIIAWRSKELAATPHSWPLGYSGSWSLLGPGLFVLFIPSILATFTTPETWRAVFVIVLALVAILLGSRLKLAAPFLGGIAVLPLENIVVFAVQSSRDIQSTPWWITLASAGAVLLVIAVTSERKASGGGIAARIRDLD